MFLTAVTIITGLGTAACLWATIEEAMSPPKSIPWKFVGCTIVFLGLFLLCLLT